MIELSKVTKVFNAGNPNEFSALNGVSVKIHQNQVTVLTGSSGSGKTTLLSIIGCMSRPTAGRVRLDGKEISSLPERFLTSIRRKTFGFIFQQPNLIKGLTVLENVMLPAYPLGEQYSQLKAKATFGLDSLGIANKATAKVEWLSGGEAQRASIARALINNPPLIIADEPTAHLDSKLTCCFMEIIERLKSEGKTIIISSHDPLVYNSSIVDCLIKMRDGKVYVE